MGVRRGDFESVKVGGVWRGDNVVPMAVHVDPGAALRAMGEAMKARAVNKARDWQALGNAARGIGDLLKASIGVKIGQRNRVKAIGRELFEKRKEVNQKEILDGADLQQMTDIKNALGRAEADYKSFWPWGSSGYEELSENAVKADFFANHATSKTLAAIAKSDADAFENLDEGAMEIINKKIATENNLAKKGGK